VLKLNSVLKLRLRLSRPVSADVLIYDRVGSHFLARALRKDVKWEIFDVRRKQVNIHPYSMARLPVFIYRKLRSRKSRWWKKVGWAILFQMAEIRAINPKLLVSFVDNSRSFNLLSRVYSTAEFLGVQNGFRGIEVAELAPHLCLPNLLCFGEEVVDRYRKENCNVSRFVVGGSLKNSLYMETTTARRQISRYDLLWISQFRPARFDSTMPVLRDNSLILLDFLQRYCEDNQRLLCIACSCKERNFSYEYQFLLRQLRIKNVHLVPNDDNNFSSYRAIDMSNVTVTVNSTIGFEAISRGNKVLFCNFSDDEYFNIPSGYSDGPWALRDSAKQYKKFEQALRNIENMNQKEWRSVSRKMGEYFVSPEHVSPTIRIFNEEVDHLISKSRNRCKISSSSAV